MRIYKFLCILVVFLCSFAISLANEVSSLSQLKQKCEEARSLSQYESLDAFSLQLLSASKNQKNPQYESYAYFYSGLAKLFLGNTDESTRMFNAADNVLLKTPNDTVKALVLNARGITQAMIENNNFVAQTFFFKSLELAKKVNYEELQLRVRGNLLTLSHSMDDSVAFENASEVYDYGVKHNNHEQIYMGAYYLATYYYNHKNYVESDKYLRTTIQLYEKRHYEDIASVYALYAKMLLNKGDIELAEAKAQHALEFSTKYHQPSMEIEVYITLAEVMSRKQKYTESIEMITKAMSIANRIGVTSKAADCNRIMAENYIAMGNTSAALKCLQKANTLLEDKAMVNMERIAHEQRIMQDIERKEMDAQMEREKMSSQRRLLAALAIAVVFLFLLLIVVVVNYRRRQILYKKIVLQNYRAVAHQKYLQERIDELTHDVQQNHKIDNKESVSERGRTTIGDEKMNALYKQLCWLMDHDCLYTESQLTRDRMAERLNTNRTYLTQVIREKTGMNYLQFVNSYRINEAINILSDKEKRDYPLKQLWSDLGFSSPSTFYKLFQQAVGITPSTYRKQILEVDDNTEVYPSEEE